jgi:Zn-dependent protease
MSFDKIFDGIIQIMVLLFAVSAHETAHAWMADKCGDPTARLMGRITLNPIPHIDIIGSIVFPLILALFGGPVFGWAKPVQVNPMNFRNYRRDNLLVSFAGPASNLILMIIGMGIFFLFKQFHFPNSMLLSTKFLMLFIKILFLFIFINLYLALFNLIPIPPLDGSHILESTLKGKALATYYKFQPYGFIVLIAMIYLGIFGKLINPLIEFFYKILL